jgi:tryptophan synthase beta chain
MTNPTRFVLDEDRIPKHWYNIAADLPSPAPAVLHPGTHQPVGPDDLAPLFPMSLIAQEVATEREVEIPEPIREVYRMWRPSPLHRARRLEKALDTPAKIYYKYEGVSPAGSHKPNTAVAQAFYNREAGVRRISTETGAGQWGSSLAFAGALFGIDVQVFMVRISYDQKPYRRALMETYGARCVPSPSEETESGRAIRSKRPDHPGSLGIAISEAVEVAAKRDDTKYALGSVLNHVLLHQTVIGLEAMRQMEMAGDDPDVVIGCAGGGSNFAGLAFPFIGAQLRGGRTRRVIAVEPAACPSLTRGRYAYDFGDTAHLTPLARMHTLGSTFTPPGFRRPAVSRHGAAGEPSEGTEPDRREGVPADAVLCRRGAVREGRRDRAGSGIESCGGGGNRRGAGSQRAGPSAGGLIQSVGPRSFRHAGLHRLFRGQTDRPGLR